MLKMSRLNYEKGCEEFVILDNGVGTLGHDWGDGPIYSEHDFEYTDENEEVAAWKEAGYIEEPC